MRTINKKIVAFHIGRGGNFNNGGHKQYLGEKKIDFFTDHLFYQFENKDKVSNILKNYPNLSTLIESSNDGCISSFNKLKSLGLDLGKLEYVSCNGNEVGLFVENNGTGVIDEDGIYDTTICKYLTDCDQDELELINNSNIYKSIELINYLLNNEPIIRTY